jgi:hypothetical protein
MNRLSLLGAALAITALPCATPAQTAAIRGRISWQSVNGVSHPVRNVRVEVIDTLTRAVVSVRPDTTDENGEYQILVNVGPNPRAVLVRAPAVSSSAFVHPLLCTEPWELSLKGFTLNPGESVRVDLDGKGETESNEAFSIIDAIHAIQPYVRTLRGAALPRVEVVFPAEQTVFDPATRVLRLELYDPWDWDVILHEFGHYLSRVENLANHPGGEYLLTENLSRTMSRGDALLMAWGEGWPTYFSISAQLAEGLAALDIPNVGDSWFKDMQDTRDTFDLASGDGIPSVGEDNVVSTSRVLFDLEDGVADYDSVALGAKAVFDTLVSVRAHTLREGIRRFLLHASQEDSIRFGAILARNHISPAIAAMADESPIDATRQERLPEFPQLAATNTPLPQPSGPGCERRPGSQSRRSSMSSILTPPAPDRIPAPP